MNVQGYKEIEYKSLQQTANEKFQKRGVTKLMIAADCKLKTHVTVTNALNIDKQVVSDEVLTNVMKCVGVNAIVMWVEGERKYFIKTK